MRIIDAATVNNGDCSLVMLGRWVDERMDQWEKIAPHDRDERGKIHLLLGL